MALTAEQKAENARQRRIRDKAHALRRADYDARMKEILPPKTLKAARDAMDRHQSEQDMLIDEADAQAKELERKAADLLEQAKNLRDAARAARVKWTGKTPWELERAAEAQCNVEFPDMGNLDWRFYAASWTPPEGSDYLERAAAIIDAKDAKKAAK